MTPYASQGLTVVALNPYDPDALNVGGVAEYLSYLDVSYRTGIETNGTFSLVDTIGGGVLSATVAWIDIFTFGTSGGLNSGGSVNLTNFAYTGGTGPSANFLAILGSTNPVTTLTFQFTPARSLSSLYSTGGSTSYSLSYSANYNPPPPVPEPASMVLLGTGLLGVAALARRRAKSGQSAK